VITPTRKLEAMGIILVKRDVEVMRNRREPETNSYLFSYDAKDRLAMLDEGRASGLCEEAYELLKRFREGRPPGERGRSPGDP
jgi:hypothetical protein